MDLKDNLLKILNESNLINKFEYWNRIEDDNRGDLVEQYFKYRVNAQNKWRIHSLELLRKNGKYKDGSLYKIRVYHANKMPLNYRHRLEELPYRFSNAKGYIDFGANTYDTLLKIANEINHILEN